MISRFVKQFIYLIRVSLQKLPLNTVLNPLLYHPQFRLECLTHLLNLHYQLLVLDRPLRLHVLYYRRVYQMASLEHQLSRTTAPFLHVLWKVETPYLQRCRLEVHVVRNNFILWLYFSLIPLFKDHLRLQKHHNWSVKSQFILHFHFLQQFSNFHFFKVISLNVKQNTQLVISFKNIITVENQNVFYIIGKVSQNYCSPVIENPCYCPVRKFLQISFLKTFHCRNQLSRYRILPTFWILNLPWSWCQNHHL